MKRLLLLATLLVATALLAGCGQQLTAGQIVQHMRDTAAATNTAHLVITAGGQMKGDNANKLLGGTHLQSFQGDVTLELWYSKPNLLRAQVLASSQSGLAGTILVHDGTYVWAYTPQTKIAYKLDVAALRQMAGKANIPADLQDMLANPDLVNAVDQVMALTDSTLGPSEKVNGYDTYRLDLKPKANSPAAQVIPDGTATLWVDQATWVPVKLTAGAAQGTIHYEMTSLELNKTLPASTFQFTLPAGAHVVDLSGIAPHTVTLAQARQEAQTAGYSLLEPGYVPTGATLIQVMASRGMMGSGGMVTLNYSGGSAVPTFWITQLNGAPMGAMGDKMQGGFLPSGAGAAQAQTVTVRGVQGHYAAQTAKAGAPASAVLWWREANSKLTVAIGGPLSQAELLKIAAGLK